MMKSNHEQSTFVELNCGCLINELSGEMHQECLPHSQANFMH